MSETKLLCIFGATGNQGGSVVDTILSSAELQRTYRLRGITRNVASAKSQELSAKGVEMISADLNNIDSLKTALANCYGVFGVTNYWDKDVLSKTKEEQQGLNIFEACKAQGVKHLIWSSLPYAERLTGGELSHVNHFDSKAAVAERMERENGDMLCSYFMPAMYMQSAKESMRIIDGQLSLVMPFPASNAFKWPFIHPRTDGGKYVAGLFEAGAAADGVHVHAVSCWTTIDELFPALSEACGRTVVFKEVSPVEYQAELPEVVAEDLTQTMLLVGGWSYYGPGREEQQAGSDRWMVEGSVPSGLGSTVTATGPWRFD